MTAAVRNQITLDALARNTELVELIHQHGDKLGPIWDFSADGNVHLDTYPSIDRATAAAYITWFYLLGTPRIRAVKIDRSDALVTLSGHIGGREYRAYGRLHGAAAAYLLGLSEPSVHALRNVQVGDVPTLDTEAAQS